MRKKYKIRDEDQRLNTFHLYETGTMKYSQDGYLFVYLVNESNVDQDVYFDDLQITHSSATQSFKISQVNDYYPFGMPTPNSYRDGGYVDPGLLYQSPYATLDSLTGYYDFLSRDYDPVLGRFPQVDPAGQFSSPYTGMGNMPHMGVDPNGEIFDVLANLFAGFIRDGLASAGQAAVNSWNGNGSFSENFAMQGVSTGFGFNTGSGYSLNSSNGYGGFTNSSGGGSQVFGGFANGGPREIGTANDAFGPVGTWQYFNSYSTFGLADFNYLPGIAGDVNPLGTSVTSNVRRPIFNGGYEAVYSQTNGGGGFDPGVVDYLALGLGAGGTYFGATGDAFYSRHHWVQGNGKVRLSSSAGNNYVLNRSKDITKAVTKNARVFSKGFGVAGSLVSAGQFLYEPTYANGFDAIMGATAFIPVAGWAISGTYFISNTITTVVTGQTIGEHIFGGSKVYGGN